MPLFMGLEPLQYICGFLLTILVLFLLAIAFARFGYKCEQANNLLLGEYSQLINQVKVENQRLSQSIYPQWPIWPRPALYTDIDQETQRTIAEAHAIIKHAYGPVCTVRLIRNYSPGFQNWINLGAANHRIWVYRYNFKRISHLKSDLSALCTRLAMIDANLNKVTERQKDVRQACEQLDENLGLCDVDLTYIEEHASHLYAKAAARLQNVRECLFSAQTSLRHEETVDGLYHAIAHTWIAIGGVYLEIFRLTSQALHYPTEKFDLDVIGRRLDEIEAIFARLVGRNSIYNWQNIPIILAWVNNHHHSTKRIFERIQEFDKNFHTYQKLVSEIEYKKIARLKISAEKAEHFLAEYWDIAGRSPHLWQQVLRNKPLPTVAVEALKADLQDVIWPMTALGRVIKESEINTFNSHLQQFFADLYKIHETRIRIQRTAQAQYDAEIEAKPRLLTNGDVTNALRKLQRIKDDSPPHLQVGCIQAEQRYQSYQERAGKRLHANYPALLSELDVFVSECSAILDDYRREMAALVSEMDRKYARLAAQRKGFQNLYNSDTLRPDAQWPELFCKFDDWLNRFQNAKGSYNLLKRLYDDVDLGIKDFDAEFSNLKIQQDIVRKELKRVNDRIVETKDQYRKQINELNKYWGTPLHTELEGICKHIQKFDELLARASALRSASTIEQARQSCDRLGKDLLALVDSVEIALEPVREDYRELTKKYNEIISLMNSASPGTFSVEGRNRAKSFALEATKAISKSSAMMCLNMALTAAVVQTTTHIHNESNIKVGDITNIGGTTAIASGSVNINQSSQHRQEGDSDDHL